MACVDVPCLALQIALRARPEWCRQPVATVDVDRPNGRILEVNESARRRGIRTGMRYAAALSIAGALRATVVSPVETESAREAIVAVLQRFSPEIERAPDVPGLFWMNVAGLARLCRDDGYGRVGDWARSVRSGLSGELSLESSVVVGFRKFATAAIARTQPGVAVFRDPGAEALGLRDVPLDRLDLAPRARDTLAKLGVRTVGAFAALPPEGIERRFGKGAMLLHREARGEQRDPFEAEAIVEPTADTVHLDREESDAGRLVHLIVHRMEPLIEEVAAQRRGVTEVEIALRLDGGGEHVERLKPAAPTTDRSALEELIRLRFESTSLTSGATDITLTLTSEAVRGRQLDLLAVRPVRDLDAASRALARLRAEFGDRAVVRARLRDAHLPEARFVWEPVSVVLAPLPRTRDSPPPMVRRIHHPPWPLPSRPRHEPDGWMLRGLDQGPVARVFGPWAISGAWWKRTVHREYHIAETQKGDLLWVYYDRERRRWYLQGRVE